MQPDVSVIVTTFERPQHLRRVLASLEGQQGVDRFEVIVSDDGSNDETREVVAAAKKACRFPLSFITQPHDGFRVGRARNAGVARASADYVVIVNGDCLLPPDYLRQQLAHRRPDVVRIGDCIWLPRETAQRVTVEMARTGEFARLAPKSEVRRRFRQAWKDWYYNLIGARRRPSLVGHQMAMSRADFELVNGFDENFVGWGNEDDDLGLRLKRAGKRLQSIQHWTTVYHLWHPPAPSCPTKLEEAINIAYARRGYRLTRCGNGLVKRSWREMTYSFRGDAAPSTLQSCIPDATSLTQISAGQRAEVEVLFAPTRQSFTGTADCNVLMVPTNTGDKLPQVRQAHFVLCPAAQAASLSSQVDSWRLFGPDEFSLAMHYLIWNERTLQPIARAA